MGTYEFAEDLVGGADDTFDLLLIGEEGVTVALAAVLLVATDENFSQAEESIEVR